MLGGWAGGRGGLWGGFRALGGAGGVGRAQQGNKSDVRIEKPCCAPTPLVAKGIDGLLGAAQGERNGGFLEEESHNGGAMRRR